MKEQSEKSKKKKTQNNAKISSFRFLKMEFSIWIISPRTVYYVDCVLCLQH